MKKEQKHPIYIVLDNIRSALNVGAIFRTCDAAHILKLCLCGITAYPPHNRIPKTALGATESVTWEHYDNTEQALADITKHCQRNKKGSELSIVSVELTDNAVNYWDHNFIFPTALIFGNEITGVSEKVLKESDTIVKIPMFGKKESLNVATSCGIVTYEVVRQYLSCSI